MPQEQCLQSNVHMSSYHANAPPLLRQATGTPCPQHPRLPDCRAPQHHGPGGWSPSVCHLHPSAAWLTLSNIGCETSCKPVVVRLCGASPYPHPFISFASAAPQADDDAPPCSASASYCVHSQRHGTAYIIMGHAPWPRPFGFFLVAADPNRSRPPHLTSLFGPRHACHPLFSSSTLQPSYRPRYLLITLQAFFAHSPFGFFFQ